MGKIVAVCISEAKGTPKQNIGTCLLKRDFGLENDAHGGNWHRQVSLLSYDKVKAFNENGAGVSHGDFGENLLVEGIDLAALPIGTVLTCGTAVLEVTQIGKECHSKCQIFHNMGDCIMPREGIFAKVLQDGQVSVGDTIHVALTAAVVTLSDKGAAGRRVDESGPLVAGLLRDAGYAVVRQLILPDVQKEIEEALTYLCDHTKVQLIVTTGGTGLSPRDVTPEATLAVAQRTVPGIAEAMRAHAMTITPKGMLSRGVAAIRGGTLIVNLPGSPKGAKENLAHVLPTLKHGIETLGGLAGECAASQA
ncbi:MAG: molybdopterin-binding protein [Defluviitaleaceae bacterium]|nr:molybdopterin-binding protein [Defluviitaleaceae bacterium]